MSDVVRRRIAALLLLCGIVVAALAIADVGPFEDPPTESEQVEAAVHEFFGAAARGDSRRFCELLTTDARKNLQVTTAQRLQTDKVPRCVQILDALADVFEGSQVKVRHVSVSGNQARVEARYKLRGTDAEPRTILLLQEDEAWRISDPG